MQFGVAITKCYYSFVVLIVFLNNYLISCLLKSAYRGLCRDS